MKLNKFNYRLPYEDKRKRSKVLFLLSISLFFILLTLAASFAYYQSFNLQNPYDSEVGPFLNNDIIILLTMNGNPITSIPDKNTGYVGSASCNNSATGNWNNSSWNIEISNLTISTTTCTINFVAD